MKEEMKNEEHTKDETTKYDLTEQEYHEALKMAELAVFMNCAKSKNPTSVFIAAQPGAGKTGLRFHVEREYGYMNFTEFDPDEVAIYHKYYDEILKEFPEESYQILQRFVRPALDTYLRNKAVQLRTNIMQEGYIDILEFQKNGGKAKLGENEDGTKEDVEVPGGYNIDINVLAVSRFESLLSSYEREQTFIEKSLPPRAVTAENHDRAYNNMLETIRQIEQKRLYDRIRVFKRGREEGKPQLVFQTGQKKYPSVVEAVLQEREKDKNRKISHAEEYLSRIQQLKDRVMKNKNQANAEILLRKIEELEQEFISELHKKEKQSR